MPSDEILIRMGVDNTPVAAGLRSVRQQFQGFSEGMRDVSHKARKDWHGAMHEIAGESPMLGLALKAIMSPIGAALSAGVMLFTSVHSWLEKLNVELDKTAANNAAAFGDMPKALKKTAEAAKELAKEYKEFLEIGAHSSEKITEFLERQLKALKSQEVVVGNLIEKEKTRMLQHVQAEVQAGKMTPEQARAEQAAIERGATNMKGIGGYRTLEAEISLRKLADTALRAKLIESQGRYTAAIFGEASMNTPAVNGRADQITAAQKHIQNLTDETKDLKSEVREAFEKAMGGQESYSMGISGAIVATKTTAEYKKFEANQVELKQVQSMLKDLERQSAADATKLELLKSRKASALADYKSYGSQLRANQGSMADDKLKRGELLSAMDPQMALVAVQKMALDEFTAKRAALVHDFQMNHDLSAWKTGIRDISTDYNKKIGTSAIDAKALLDTMALVHKALTEGVITVKGVE